MKKIIPVTLLLTLFLLTVSSVNADTNISSNDNLGQTIDNVNNGDTINLGTGTYINNVTNIKLNKNITMVGKVADKTIIDAKKNGRIFTITGNSNIIFINITFINGKSISGGAIYNVGGKLTLINCTFINNIATCDGGAIFTSNCLSISSSKFINNRAANGGALYSSSSLTVVKSIFSSNQAKNNGGAIYANKATVVKENSKFTSNSAYKGAAIFSRNKLTIFKSVFKNNKACLKLSIFLTDRVVKYGKTKVNVKFEANNNVKAKNANHAIWSTKIKNVKIDGKIAKKYTLPKNIKLSIKINNKKTKIQSKMASAEIKTYPNYKWKNFVFKVNYGGNSYINKTSVIYKVSSRIANTDVYNVNKNKKSKYYVPYRNDKLQTKINSKIYSKTIKQKASNNAYFLGGEKVPQDLQKFLAGWKGVVDVNETSIKKQTITILKSKNYGIGGKLTPLKKAKSIHKWIYKNIKYSLSSDFGGSTVLKKRYGNCGGYCNLYASLARTAGIPTSYLYMSPKDYTGTHVLLVVYIKTGPSWKIYKVEPQVSKFNYNPWKPSKLYENDNIYGSELVFPHWYVDKEASFNFIRYFSLQDYNNPTYTKNAYINIG